MVLLFFFTIEAGTKVDSARHGTTRPRDSSPAVYQILAYGWCPYWSDNWNKLDILIVVSGYPGFFLNSANLSVIRTFRMLRPLRHPCLLS